MNWQKEDYAEKYADRRAKEVAKKKLQKVSNIGVKKEHHSLMWAVVFFCGIKFRFF